MPQSLAGSFGTYGIPPAQTFRGHAKAARADATIV
jgi:hypothetical protein